MRLGWTDTTTGHTTWTQPSPRAAAGRYIPLCNDTDSLNTFITHENVIAHGFKLDTKGYLPGPIMRFLSEHDQVPWSHPDEQIGD